MLWTIAGVLTVLWILGMNYIHHPWRPHPYFDCNRYYCTGDTVLQAEKINHSIFVVTVFCASDASNLNDTAVIAFRGETDRPKHRTIGPIPCAMG